MNVQRASTFEDVQIHFTASTTTRQNIIVFYVARRNNQIFYGLFRFVCVGMEKVTIRSTYANRTCSLRIVFLCRTCTYRKSMQISCGDSVWWTYVRGRTTYVSSACSFLYDSFIHCSLTCTWCDEIISRWHFSCASLLEVSNKKMKWINTFIFAYFRDRSFDSTHIHTTHAHVS